MNLTNQELIQEVEKRVKSQQISLEIQPDTVKACSWSRWENQLILKTDNYELNLTKLLAEMKENKHQHCNFSSCPPDFFSFLFRNFRNN